MARHQFEAQACLEALRACADSLPPGGFVTIQVYRSWRSNGHRDQPAEGTVTARLGTGWAESLDAAELPSTYRPYRRSSAGDERSAETLPFVGRPACSECGGDVDYQLGVRLVGDGLERLGRCGSCDAEVRVRSTPPE